MVDYQKELTVFLVSVDDDTPNLRHCRAALAKQDCKFIIKSIHNVAPMDRAFQEMINRCETPYFIQVDMDMILYPDGIKRLFDGMKEQDDTAVIYCLPLWDVHLQRTILGCKCYRADIMKRYPYRDSFSCEMDQVNRMKEDGFKTVSVWSSFKRDSECVGDHGAHYTPLSVFVRYKRLIEKSRMYPWIEWVGVLPKEFKERYESDKSDLNFYALAGAMAGLTSNIDDCEGEMDYRKVWRLPEFERIDNSLYPKGPSEFILYATDKCNMKCKWCRRTLVDMEPTGDVGLNHIKAALDKFPSLKVCCIAGFGEPLMHHNLWGLTDYLKSEGIFMGLITNGTLVEKNMANLRKAGLGYISVSLNAIDAEGHKEVTKTNTFNNVVSGIKALVKESFTDVFVSFVTSKSNLKDIPKLLDLCGEWGVEKLDLLNLLPHADNKLDDESFWSEVLQEEDKDVTDALDELAAHPQAFRVRNWPILVSRKNNPRLCRSPFISFGINGLGFAGGCRRVFPPAREHGHITGGNVWNSAFLFDLRAQLLGDRPLSDACSMCFGNWKLQ